MSITPGKKSYVVAYVLNKKQMQFSPRDFVDKNVTFFSNNKLYRYTSSIDKSEVDGVYDPSGPLRSLEDPKDQVRGFTLINVQVI